LVLGAALTCGVVIVVALLRFLFPAETLHSTGGILAGILLGMVGYRMIRAIAAPRPESVQLAVKTAIIGVIVFDAALVASTRGPWLGIPVLVLLIPAVWFGTWLYST
jgi:phosphatidylserine synthase